MSFRNRREAGRRLAGALDRYRGRKPVVLALPRGGVPVAVEVAQALDAPLDLLIVRKIGVPFQPELAMGAVVDGPAPLVVRNEDVIRLARIAEDDFDEVLQRELAEIERRREAYLGGRAHAEIEGKTAIVIDDGVATGATTRAALRAVRGQKPARLVLAVPVGPTDAIAELKEETDEVVCLEQHRAFMAIGTYYADFSPVSDEEVRAIMARFPADRADAAGG